MHSSDDAERISLYHGTSKAVAERILLEGFQPVDVAQILEALADEFSMDVAAIRSHWATGFAVSREKREEPWVYFESWIETAASYARRGSEIRHNGLVAIWHLTNRPFDARPANKDDDLAGREWAKAQAAKTHTPVVVEVSFPVEQLRPGTVQNFRDEKLSDRIRKQMFKNYTVAYSKIARDWIVGFREVAPCTCWRDRPLCEACAVRFR